MQSTSPTGPLAVNRRPLPMGAAAPLKRPSFALEARILVVLFFIYLGLYSSLRDVQVVKIGFYAFPPLLVLVGYVQGGFRAAALPWLLSGLLAAYAIMSIALGSFDGPEIAFLFLSAAMFLVRIRSGIPLDRLCALAGLTYVLLNPSAAVADIFGGAAFKVYSVNVETGALEASMALVFGPAAFVSLYRKDWTFFVVNTAFLIILSKRIALLSLTFGLTLYFADFVLRGTLRRSRVFGISMVMIAAAAGARMPRLLEFIRTALNWDVNLNVLTAGRYYVQSRFLYVADAHFSIPKLLVGHGVGAHHALLDRVTWSLSGRVSLLHNDWLRIVYDYGLVGVVVACAVFVSVSRMSRLHFAIAGYTVAVFLTGNAFGYVFYWAILSLVSLRVPRNGVASRWPGLPAPSAASATGPRLSISVVSPGERRRSRAER